MRSPTVGDVLLFLREVTEEHARAMKKFPDPRGSMTALTEEVGELAKALLDESEARIREEAVQVAVMAIRVALEGDPTLDVIRARRAVPASRERTCVEACKGAAGLAAGWRCKMATTPELPRG